MVINKQYEEAQDQLHQKEQYNQAIVRDHLELKHVFELEERAQNEENEVLNQDN